MKISVGIFFSGAKYFVGEQGNNEKNMAQMSVGRIKSSICWTNMHEKYGLRVGLPMGLWFETRSDFSWGIELLF